MKKIIAILLLIASLSLMFACNDEEETPDTPPVDGEQQEPGPENNWGDFDGDGTTDSIQGPGWGPIAPVT